MCGIAGYALLSEGERISDKEHLKIRSVLKKLELRGPDGNGTASGDVWIFGHARLAIIDPKAGRQPWRDEASGAVLTYNGEIYNYKEIREELKSKGHLFRTNCDTEVVLASYLEWGEQCVEKFNGFFAFAVVDPRKKRIFAARDRLGIKPFYYMNNGREFCFCSVIPGIISCAEQDFAPDLEAVSHYLTTGKLTFGDKTMLEGIKALLPGHVLSLDLKTKAMKLRRYWRLPILSPEDKKGAMPFAQAAQETKALLEDSIQKRLMSDVPLGAFLSGGLDSAIITTTAFKHLRASFPMFCAGTDDEEMNEFKYADMVAAQLKAKLNHIRVSPGGFSRDWSFLISQKGLPLSTPNEVSIYRLSTALRKECAVTLTGEGADEIFGGYVQPHFSAYDFDRCARDIESSDKHSPFAMSMIMHYGRSFFINDTDHYTATSCWTPYGEKAQLFQKSVWDELEEDNSLFAFYEDYFNELESCSSFDKRMHLHADFNLENLLNRVDNCSMSASVEARVPFNDHRIAEFAFKLPDDYKMRWKSHEAQAIGRELSVADIDRQCLLETKCLPRRAFASSLPKEVVQRKKMSFPVPFEKWFYGDLFEELKELCLSSRFSKTHFNAGCVEKMISRKDRNLWLVANLCKWDEVIRGV